ncbi:hypothetical protein OK351_11645 [Glutamicibacter sp. MNS18]|uniref:hypothetical protein n=1 Tax=Glutamicibacter sp. MNS18 TaxID=2989817 RepID=UPI002236AF93|nr:hypothetical protein [Glutamicibacter sp. MNS18]MCW4466152.1 hypothetical protein [Glutamicibacter sp. MNS18]
MKKTVHLLSGLALAAALAGCTSSSPDPGAAADTEPGQASEEINENTSIDPLATEVAQEPVEEDIEFLEELGVNDRGNVDIEAEETALFEVPESDTVFAEFIAQNVTTDFQCTADDALEPINGQFVALDFQVNADEELPESGFPYFYLTVHEFRAWDADGERIADPVGNAETCIGEDERVPSPIDPGDNASGLVILDVPEGPGSASFSMGGYQGSYGWEWSW